MKPRRWAKLATSSIAQRQRPVPRPAGALHLDRRHAAHWRGQGFFRALTEQQELWAIEQGFDEIVVKTKNKFYDMRGTLDPAVRGRALQRNGTDNASRRSISAENCSGDDLPHRSKKAVVKSRRPHPHLALQPSVGQPAHPLPSVRRAWSGHM